MYVLTTRLEMDLDVDIYHLLSFRSLYQRSYFQCFKKSQLSLRTTIYIGTHSQLFTVTFLL